MALRLPKIASAAIERNRVQAWLELHAKTALRFVCAPAGSGKTTCAVLYARNQIGNVAFVSLAPQTGELSLLEAVSRCAGYPAARNYAELVEQLATARRLEIIIDDVDNASPQARALLGQLYLDVPDEVTFLYLARSEASIPVRRGRAGGLVEMCDPALLAFDADDVARCTAAFGFEADRWAATRLCEATHGWALAVSGACRTAAAD